MHDMKQQSIYVKSVLNKLMKQPFVEKHIEQPFIDEDKLQLSYYLFHNQQQAWNKSEKYIIATLLIQIAIDIHERIPSENEAAIAEIEKQLAVLVGDYYSGMYYYILSELEDIEMIRIVAQSIKVINEQKMNVYYHHIDSFEQLLHSMTIIESAFFTELLRKRKQTDFIPVIETFLIANRLLRESHGIANGKFSYFTQFIERYNLKHGAQIQPIEWVEREYMTQVEKLMNLIAEMNDKTNILLQWLMECHQPLLKTTVVKEGLR